MTNNQPRNSRETWEKLLDLLVDALEERQAERRAATTPQPSPKPATAPAPAAAPRPAPAPGSVAPQQPKPQQPSPPPSKKRAPQPGEADWEPAPRVASIGFGQTLRRLFLLVAALAVIVNIPLFRYGVSLARVAPDERALVIRDGLLVKGEGPDVYVLEDGALRWISSLQAFELLGYQWHNVHMVEDAFIAEFPQGEPIHVLFKCPDSDHIYRIEAGYKRWIQDIPTFEAEGHVWDDVHMVDCDTLRDIPDGPPIPEDAGAPPQP